MAINIEVVKRNVKRILDQGGTEEDVNQYITPLGVTPDDLRYGRIEPQQVEPEKAVLSEEAERYKKTPTGHGFGGSPRSATEAIMGEGRAIGATAGALRGSAHGPAGTIIGGILGGLAGEEFTQLGELALDKSTAPKSTLESLKRIAKAGVVSGIEEIAGTGVFGVAGRVLQPLKLPKRYDEETRAAFESLQGKLGRTITGQHRPPLMPHEITTGKGTAWLGNVAENSLFGQRHIARLKIKREGVAIDAVNDLADAFGQAHSPTELGNMIALVSKGQHNWFKESVTAPFYNAIKELAPDATAQVKMLKDFVNTKKAKFPLAGYINSLDDVISYDMAKDLKTMLYKIADSKSLSGGDQLHAGMAKQMVKKLDDVIAINLKLQSSDAYKVWRFANDLHQKGMKKYRNTFMLQLLRKAENLKPHTVLKQIYEKNGVTGLKNVFSIMPPKMRKRMKSWHVHDLVNQATSSTKNGVEFIDGTKLINLIGEGKAGYGEDFLKLSLGDTLPRLRKLTLALTKSQRVTGGGTGGGMMIQLAQAGSAGAAISGQWKRVGLTILMVPEVISRIFTSPTWSKIFFNSTKNLKSPRAIPGAIMRLTNLSHTVEKQILEDEKQKLLEGNRE